MRSEGFSLTGNQPENVKEVVEMADANNQQGGDMTVREAGRKGGEKTSQEFGREHYQQIGHKGGEKVHDLVEKGKQVDESM